MSAPQLIHKPIQSPATIAAAPITRIRTSRTSQSGACFGLSLAMFRLCPAITRAPMKQVTLAHRCTSERCPPPLSLIAHRAEQVESERERVGKGPPAAPASAPIGFVGSPTMRVRSRAGFPSAGTVHAPAPAPRAGKMRMRSNFPRDRMASRPSARPNRAVIQRSRNFEKLTFFSRTQTVTFPHYSRKGFRYCPRALRRTVLQILSERDRLTAQELAGIAFTTGRPVIRPGYRLPSEGEVSSTRRAIRRLIAAGKVEKCGRVRRSSRQRSRNIYAPTT